MKQSLLNLTTFPFVAATIEKGTFELHGAWFSIGQGELRWLDHERGTFDLVSTRAPLPKGAGPKRLRSERPWADPAHPPFRRPDGP